MESQVSVLFTQKNSTYNSLDVDCWDEQRNALNYSGQNRLICHPPCRLFSRLKKFSTAPACEKLLGIYAVLMVRKYGGVVEQPAGSSLWKLCNITRSPEPDEFGGYVINVQQNWFGYQCKKSTDLYIVGCPLYLLPALPLNFTAIKNAIGNSQSLPAVNSKESRSFTTLPFARWLIEIAKKSKGGSAASNHSCISCLHPLTMYNIAKGRCPKCDYRFYS